MPWANLDDHFHDNPKVLDTPLPAVGLYAIGLSYCSAHSSDGYIPRGALIGLHGWTSAARTLVERRFWEPAEGGGFRVHDYLNYNRSREEILADRESARERKRQSRRDNHRTSHPDNEEMSQRDKRRTSGPRARNQANPIHSGVTEVTPGNPSNSPPNGAADGAPPRRADAMQCPICSRTFIGPYSDHKCDPLQRPKRLPGLGRLLPREAREPPPAEVLAELEVLERTRADRQAEAARQLQEHA